MTIDVYCVTEDSNLENIQPHPNLLTGSGNSDGDGVVYRKFIENYTSGTDINFDFTIVSTRRDDMKNILKHQREKNGIFAKEYDINNLNSNAVKLYFQVYLGKLEDCDAQPLQPILSDVICNKTKLEIIKISDDWAPMEGGKSIMVYGTFPRQKNIEIRFSYNVNYTDGSKHFFVFSC